MLFGFTGRQQIQIPLAGRQESFLIPFGSELCGEVHVKVEKAVCYDLFGLCRAELDVYKRQLYSDLPRAAGGACPNQAGRFLPDIHYR